MDADAIIKVGAIPSGRFTSDCSLRVPGSCGVPNAEHVLAHYAMEFLQLNYTFVGQKNESWGDYINGHPTGIFKELADGVIDMVIPHFFPYVWRANVSTAVNTPLLWFEWAFVVNRATLTPKQVMEWWNVWPGYVWIIFAAISLLSSLKARMKWSHTFSLELGTALSGCAAAAMFLIFSSYFGNMILNSLLTKTGLPFETLVEVMPLIPNKYIPIVLSTGSLNQHIYDGKNVIVVKNKLELMREIANHDNRFTYHELNVLRIAQTIANATEVAVYPAESLFQSYFLGFANKQFNLSREVDRAYQHIWRSGLPIQEVKIMVRRLLPNRISVGELTLTGGLRFAALTTMFYVLAMGFAISISSLFTEYFITVARTLS